MSLRKRNGGPGPHFWCLTFWRNASLRVTEPIVQCVAAEDDEDYGWQSYVVLPRELGPI